MFLVRCQDCPHEIVDEIFLPLRLPQLRQVKQKQIAQRPSADFFESRRVVPGYGADDEREISEVAPSALAVAGASLLWFEEFGEVFKDSGSRRKKNCTWRIISRFMVSFSSVSVIAAKRAAFFSASS